MANHKSSLKRIRQDKKRICTTDIMQRLCVMQFVNCALWQTRKRLLRCTQAYRRFLTSWLRLTLSTRIRLLTSSQAWHSTSIALPKSRVALWGDVKCYWIIRNAAIGRLWHFCVMAYRRFACRWWREDDAALCVWKQRPGRCGIWWPVWK